MNFATLTTASIMTEASNLLGNESHRAIAPGFVQVAARLVEIVRAKDDICAYRAFPRLGFADCSTLLALDRETTLLTDDSALYLEALAQGFDSINFNHLRSLI